MSGKYVSFRINPVSFKKIVELASIKKILFGSLYTYSFKHYCIEKCRFAEFLHFIIYNKYKKMQERLCKVITIILASIKIITNKNKIYNIKLTKSFKKINYWLTIKNKFDIINMVKYMNEYMILIVILIFLLLIYTIYILVDENSNQTEWERCNKILKRQERQIKIKKIKLFF